MCNRRPLNTVLEFATIRRVVMLLRLYILLQETTVERRAIQALVLSRIGIGLTLPYYGAETYGLHAIGQVEIDLFILIYFF
jgi:hypothetical protein